MKVVQRLTGPDLTDNVAVGGTDLGIMVNHLGRTYFLFGDTTQYDGPWSQINSGDPPAFWRSSTMAYTSDQNPADGIKLEGWITDGAGRARETILPANPPVISEIPTGAISLNGRIYAWFMGVDSWDPWTAKYGGLATWQAGQPTFNVIEPFEFPGNQAGGNFAMVAVSLRTDPSVTGDSHVYLWGTPAGRGGGVKLARVSPDHASITNPSAYEYFGGTQNGQPVWVDSEFDAPLIVQPAVGEMSVMYNEALHSWTMMYFSPDRYQIEVRQAPQPWGPWSNPVKVATGAQFPQLYGSFMNPLYVENGGQTVYFTMSMWHPYDVYLMKATYITVPDPPGDFNNDGIVDSADYVVWRNGSGSQSDYNTWRSNFGKVASGGAGTGFDLAIVPEPRTIFIAVIYVLGFYPNSRRRRS